MSATATSPTFGCNRSRDAAVSGNKNIYQDRRCVAASALLPRAPHPWPLPETPEWPPSGVPQRPPVPPLPRGCVGSPSRFPWATLYPISPACGGMGGGAAPIRGPSASHRSPVSYAVPRLLRRRRAALLLPRALVFSFCWFACRGGGCRVLVEGLRSDNVIPAPLPQLPPQCDQLVARLPLLRPSTAFCCSCRLRRPGVARGGTD